MRYAQLVMGPAGSGKSTYCSAVVKHCEVLRRTVRVVNLDPAAESFDYPVLADVKDLISVSDVMEDSEIHLGPNGGLIFCLEYLAQNFDWLQEQLGDDEDDYILFDCPGQIELYTHLPIMSQLVEKLHSMNFYVCGVFLVDSQFLIEVSKFISGVLSALSAMVSLQIPHVNVMTKLDLLSKKSQKDLERYLEPDLRQLMVEQLHDGPFGRKYQKLSKTIASVIDDYALVKFLPLYINDEDSMNAVLANIDSAIQYGEDMEPREPKDEEGM